MAEELEFHKAIIRLIYGENKVNAINTCGHWTREQTELLLEGLSLYGRNSKMLTLYMCGAKTFKQITVRISHIQARVGGQLFERFHPYKLKNRTQ